MPQYKEQAEKWGKLKIYKNNNNYVVTLVHSKLNDKEGPLGKSHRICKREFDLRYINSATKFGEKNPNENGKFLSSIFINISGLIAIISERKFLELLH